jgi:hypothetical protein
MAVISFSSRGLPFRWRGPAEAPTRPSSSNPPDTQIVPTYCQKRSLSTVLATREQPTVKCCSLMLVIASVRAQREPLQHQRKPQFPVVGQEKKASRCEPQAAVLRFPVLQHHETCQTKVEQTLHPIEFCASISPTDRSWHSHQPLFIGQKDSVLPARVGPHDTSTVTDCSNGDRIFGHFGQGHSGASAILHKPEQRFLTRRGANR